MYVCVCIRKRHSLSNDQQKTGLFHQLVNRGNQQTHSTSCLYDVFHSHDTRVCAVILNFLAHIMFEHILNKLMTLFDF